LLKPERLLQQWEILASTAWAIRPAAATSFRPVSQVTDVFERVEELEQRSADQVSGTVSTRQDEFVAPP
jgi:hypothetical protein